MSHLTQFEHLKIQLEAIISATNNFANENCIGGGGFGKVYQGEINHSKGQQTIVALKRLDRKFGQGDPEFWKEIMLLSFYKHDNIVSLLGYCDDSGEKILAYEYASKKSLDIYLNNNELNWVRRLKICIGAARGLAYLHTPGETQLRVLHRDIKSANILLDENWNAKISDFGLSKFGPANQQFTYLISNAVGTYGYCDPLYAETGLLTKESDVYSFAVVLFEVLCGRLCFSNNSCQPLVGLVRERYQENKLNEIIFDNIKDEINPDSLKTFTEIAYQCLKRDREGRPLMTEVVKALEDALKYQCPEPPKPPRAGILNVKVLNAMWLKKRNPYMILRLHKNILNSTKKTTAKHKNVNPEWNEEFTLYVQDLDNENLEIWVHNVTSLEMHDCLGTAMVYLQNHDLTPEKPETVTAYIFKDMKVGRDYTSQGTITVEVVYKPLASYTNFEDVCPLQKAPIGTPQGGGLLVVIIHQGDRLEGSHHSNPYVSLLFRGEFRKTLSIKKTDYSVWEEEFTFMLEHPPTDEEELHLEVISTPWKGIIYRKEESLGYANISLAEVVNEKRINKKYHIYNSKHDDASVEVELQWRTAN